MEAVSRMVPFDPFIPDETATYFKQHPFGPSGLYWIWECPFQPSDAQQPAGIYTNCMDIYIVPEEVESVSGQDLNEMGIRKHMFAS